MRTALNCIFSFSRQAAPVIVATLLAAPAFAITVASGNPNSAPYKVGYDEAVEGVNLSGVAMITSSIGGCTGSLLADGLSILTAGHCVTSAYGAALASNIKAAFQGSSGFLSYSVSTVFVNPGYTGDSTQGGDLAILRLNAVAPTFATRYQLFTDTPTTAPDVIAGYGYGGTGTAGANSSLYPFGTLRAGTNAYVTTGASIGWSSTLLLGQFYDASTPSTNAFNVANPYSASNEVDISHGDSGGPSFQNGMLIGVHDLGVCFGSSSGCSVPPSISTTNNSYFGQVFADVSVASNATWIESYIVPEPGTFALFLIASVAMACVAIKRNGSRFAFQRALSKIRGQR